MKSLFTIMLYTVFLFPSLFNCSVFAYDIFIQTNNSLPNISNYDVTKCKNTAFVDTAVTNVYYFTYFIFNIRQGTSYHFNTCNNVSFNSVFFVTVVPNGNITFDANTTSKFKCDATTNNCCSNCLNISGTTFGGSYLNPYAFNGDAPKSLNARVAIIVGGFSELDTGSVVFQIEAFAFAGLGFTNVNNGINTFNTLYAATMFNYTTANLVYTCNDPTFCTSPSSVTFYNALEWTFTPTKTTGYRITTCG